MLWLRFTSDQLVDFESASFGDHIKVFLAGSDHGEGACPPMRDFTPRRFDSVAGTIAINFAIPEAGPAIDWAKAAKIEDIMTIGGPRGPVVIPDDVDLYWLIGDETALPAGEGFVWIAAEASAAPAMCGAVIARGHPTEWLKAAGYWQRGTADAHVRIED